MSESTNIKEKEIKNLKESIKLLEKDNKELSSYYQDIRNSFTVLEFVAIPVNFDISSFLSLREQVGISKYDGIDLEQVKFFAETVKHSPVLGLFNTNQIGPLLYLLSIFEELNLIVTSIHNPIRKRYQQYENFIENNLRLSPKERYNVNIILINIFPLMGDKIIEESLKIAENLQQYQTELNKSLGKISNLDLTS